LLYLAISIAVTIWVARTLNHNGRQFLVRGFDGVEEVADSVNHLLVVGFYLVNIGYELLALRFGERPNEIATAIEFLSTKIGLVLLVLGAIHLGNMYAISRWGCRYAHNLREVL
jgi:hypothetical protein